MSARHWLTSMVNEFFKRIDVCGESPQSLDFQVTTLA